MLHWKFKMALFHLFGMKQPLEIDIIGVIRCIGRCAVAKLEIPREKTGLFWEASRRQPTIRSLDFPLLNTVSGSSYVSLERCLFYLRLIFWQNCLRNWGWWICVGCDYCASFPMTFTSEHFAHTRSKKEINRNKDAIKNMECMWSER